MNEEKFRLTRENKRETMRTVWDKLDGWLEGGDLELSVREWRSKRTVRQNRRLWAAVYDKLAENAWVDGRRFDSDTWHEYCKGRFLGYEVYRLQDGSEMKRPISTTTLNTAEMAEYQNNIQAWAATEFGIIWDV
ncbi:recombination protein NinB [Neisseria polysaccharea]|uniref:recombination protein NinB n=1 Tax=Neisseria polysaccharea TaxID=489 RepID=UPI0027E19D5A|nr:recombination protein NinB [Neisseria polysaccharea]